MLYHPGMCPKMSGVPIWTITAAAGVAVLIAVVAVILRFNNIYQKKIKLLELMMRDSKLLLLSLSLFVGERDLKKIRLL